MTRSFQSNPAFYLLPDEKIIFKTNPHRLFIVIPEIAIFLFWIFYMVYACSYISVIDINGLESFCLIMSSFATFFLMIILYLDWKFNRLCLTNTRLIKERGIIGKSFMSIWLKNIEDITCNFGIWGRILRFGNLIIESAGTHGKMVFTRRPNPLKIKLMIDIELKNIIHKTNSKISFDQSMDHLEF